MEFPGLAKLAGALSYINASRQRTEQKNNAIGDRITF